MHRHISSFWKIILTAIVLVAVYAFAALGQAPAKEYKLTELQQLKLQVMQRDAQLAQVTLKEAQSNFQQKVSDLMAGAQKVKLEQGWPPETVFNPDTLQFSAPAAKEGDKK